MSKDGGRLLRIINVRGLRNTLSRHKGQSAKVLCDVDPGVGLIHGHLWLGLVHCVVVRLIVLDSWGLRLSKKLKDIGNNRVKDFFIGEII